MSLKHSYADKGKGIAHSSKQPTQSRVKVPSFDNSELIRKHSLTLIGRITNPRQRIWSLIPFLADLWKTSSRAIGADLGQGVFQFQMASEEDMKLVLENRPYHFAKWMIILQKWEPSVSRDFPYQIPFWIKVQGVPKHLWSEETFKSIGNDIGVYEKQEITEATVRMRVHMNGLLPLIMSSVLEFDNGDEVLATLVYEKLEKHCTICMKLDHEKHDCSSQNKTALPQKNETRHSYLSLARKDLSYEHTIYRRKEEQKRISPPTRNYHNQNKLSQSSSHRSLARSYPYQDCYRSHPEQRQPAYNYSSQHQSYNHHKEIRREHSSHLSHSGSAAREKSFTNVARQQVWREKPRITNTLPSPPKMREEVSESSKSRRPPLERNIMPSEIQNGLPQQAFEEALGELREVMVQYTSCADPSESAARKERLRQAEEAGQFEETAAQMVLANMEKQTHVMESDIVDLPQERTPAILRLGPTIENTKGINNNQKKATSKNKPGRLAGKKQTANSPSKLPGASSRKRKSIQIGTPPRKKLTLTPHPRGVLTQQTAAQASGARKSNESEKEAGGVHNPTAQPQIYLIPTSKKKTMDFRDPSDPLP